MTKDCACPEGWPLREEAVLVTRSILQEIRLGRNDFDVFLFPGFLLVRHTGDCDRSDGILEVTMSKRGSG